MEKKKMIYSAPVTEIESLTNEEIMHYWTGGNWDNGSNWGAKKRNGTEWGTDDEVDPVGTSAGSGNSPLELPSSGKLWDE